jgi:hypothetical protein
MVSSSMVGLVKGRKGRVVSVIVVGIGEWSGALAIIASGCASNRWQ